MVRRRAPEQTEHSEAVANGATKTRVGDASHSREDHKANADIRASSFETLG
jgi:hypothetical protein